jgi:3-phenylpropionate/cinnamic acid dioxygenase small subunit
LLDQTHVFFGRSEHDIARRDGAWLIARKKAILENDRIPAAIDVYCL